MKPTNLDGLEKLVAEICDEYVRKWKTEGVKYINVPSYEHMYAEGNWTPIEQEWLLTTRLRMLSKSRPEIPSSIPLLPLPILRRLSIHLTKTLEIQVNLDHYEFWAWSAEVFKSFEDSIPILKNEYSTKLLYLLFHICLAKLGYPPFTSEAMVLNRVTDAVIDRHVHHIISQKFVIGIPIAAVTFEVLLKTFTKLYGSEEAKMKLEKLEKSKRATFGRVLSLFKKEVLPNISQDLQLCILELNKIVENIWNMYGKNWVKILLTWRNKFMHGALTWAPRAFGVYTNYICLILWHLIPHEEYKRKQNELLKIIKWQGHLVGVERYWSFYPP